MNRARWPFIKKLAKKLERTTMFSAKVTEQIGRQFDYLEESQLAKLLPCIQDMAACYAIDLASAADLVRSSFKWDRFPNMIAQYAQTIKECFPDKGEEGKIAKERGWGKQ